MLWMTFSLLAAILWAMVNIIDKYTMSKLVQAPAVPVLVFGVVGLLSVAPISWVHGFLVFSFFHAVMAFLAGAFYVLTLFFYYQALKREEVSKVIPLYYLAPVFIVLIAHQFLHETLFPIQYLGIIFLVSGAILTSLPKPFKLQMNQAVGYMLLAAMSYAMNQVLTKYLVEKESFWSVFVYIRIGIFMCLLPVFYWSIQSVFEAYQKHGYRAYAIMTMNQCLNLAGVLSITFAVSSGYVTLVNAIVAVQPFFVLVFATLLSLFLPKILSETYSRSIIVRKCIALVLILSGVVMVS